MMEKNRILTICLVISLALNVIFISIFLKNAFVKGSYEGTWKCTTNNLYEITIFVDHNGTFYEALEPIDMSSYDINLTKDLPYIVYKGYIENDALVYKGSKILVSDDNYEYLSDIPDEQYEPVSYFYSIVRNGKTTLMIEIPEDSKTKYTFVKVDE